MIVLVTGSRHHDPIRVRDHIVKTVKGRMKDPSERVIIVHGDADGADYGAHRASKIVKEWGEFRLPAQWSVYGKPAGSRRNREMPDLLAPDYCLAYPLPDSRGTYDMIQYAQDLNIPVSIFEDKDV